MSLVNLLWLAVSNGKINSVNTIVPVSVRYVFALCFDYYVNMYSWPSAKVLQAHKEKKNKVPASL